MSAIRYAAACLCVVLLASVGWRTDAAPDPDEEPVDLTISDARPTFTNGVGMKLVWIKPGTFMMGTTKAERDAVRADLQGKRNADFLVNEKARHRVTLTRGFYVGAHEVTQRQYQLVMGHNPSAYSRNGGNRLQVQNVKDEDLEHFPVEMVSYHDALKFLEKLSALPSERQHGRVYRLPTEAEWEYCCRAGADVSEAFTLKKPSASISSKYANFDGNFPFGGGEKHVDLGRTTRVGSYDPNPWGLYDMHGNLWEMTSDWYDENAYLEKRRIDPTGPPNGKIRVIRGGSWASNGEACRSGYRRFDFTPETRGNNYGFRVVCTAPR